MKALKAIMVIWFFLLSTSLLYSQTNLLGYQPRQLQFIQPSNQLFIPSMSSPSYSFILGTNTLANTQTCVIKSTVHYTAFFCKMEVKTVNALGIMIKVHAGDYDRYTTGTDQPQP